MAKGLLDTTITVKDALYLGSFAVGFILQHFMLKMEIHDAIVQAAAEKQIMNARVTILEQRIGIPSSKQDATTYVPPSAILPNSNSKRKYQPL